MSGWIKLHRQTKDHWIWQDPLKLKWWLTMIMEVNYKEGRMFLGNDVHTVRVGQSSRSIRGWSDLFGCSTKATINFFSLLQKEGMITKETIGKGKHSTTIINISNYTLFQGADETQEKRKGNAKETQEKHKGYTIEESKEGEECKETKNNIYRKFSHLSITNDEVKKLLNDYDKNVIDDVLDSIQNYSKNKNYSNLYLTAKKWLAKRNKKTDMPVPFHTQNIYAGL